MKMFDFECTKCDKTFEALVSDNQAPPCPKCGDSEYIKRAVSLFGGYSIKGDNSASVTPKQAGGFKRPKSYQEIADHCLEEINKDGALDKAVSDYLVYGTGVMEVTPRGVFIYRSLGALR